MQNETIIAGFGGQGLLFAGRVLAQAALAEGLEVTWFPSYGPEMRGGTANCTVIISDEEIGSPLVLNPKAVIAMNLPSLDKYEPLVQKNGYLVVNTSLVNREVKRKDIQVIAIPATEEAEKLGDKRLANIILLGGLVKQAGFLPLKAVEEALLKELGGKKEMQEMNLKALKCGVEY